MSGEVEQQVQEHYIEPFDNGERVQQFLDLLRPDAEVWQPKLQGVIDCSLALSVNPAEQRLVQIAGGIMDWLLFASPGSPAPEGVVYTKFNSSDELYVSLDAYKITGKQATGILKNVMVPNGYGRLAQELRRDFWQRMAKTLPETFRGILESTLIHSLLQSFDDAHLYPKEQPLSHFMRQAREAQVTEMVRKRHGISHSEDIPAGTMAARALKRELFRLEEETVATKVNSQEDDPYSRARRFFAQYFEDFLETPFIHRDGMVCQADGEWIKIDRIYGVAEKVIEEFGEHVPEAFSNMFELGFVGLVINKLFESRSSWPSWQEFLNEVTNEHIDGIYKEQLDVIPQYYLSGLVSACGDMLRPRGIVLTNNDPYYPSFRNTNADFSVTNRPDKPKIVSGSLAEREEAMDYGIARWVNSEKDMAKRLVISAPFNTRIPEFSSETELIVAISEKQRWSDPLVLGYRLVWRNFNALNTVYGFIRDSEGDPYTPTDIRIDTSKLKGLAEEYRAIGLDDLANALRAEESWTLEQLVGAIEASSFPTDDFEKYEGRSDESFETIAAFARFVDDEVLRVQCSGAAIFLRNTLNYLFGPGAASIQTGRVLVPEEERIPYIGHVQTVFSYQGHTYLLDSSPKEIITFFEEDNGSDTDKVDVIKSAAYSSSVATSRSREMDLAEIQEVTEDVSGEENGMELADQAETLTSAPKPPKYQPVDTVPLESNDPVSEDKEGDKLEAASFLRQKLETQLQVIFDARDRDDFYRKVVNLRKYDAVRRTLEIVGEAARGKIVGKEEAERLLDYLDNYSSLPSRAMKQQGLQSYGPSTLSILQSAARKLLKIIGTDTISDKPEPTIIGETKPAQKIMERLGKISLVFSMMTKRSPRSEREIWGQRKSATKSLTTVSLDDLDLDGDILHRLQLNEYYNSQNIKLNSRTTPSQK